MRPIDADALEVRLEQDGKLTLNMMCILDEMPTVEAEPAPHGYWKSILGEILVECSECKTKVNSRAYKCILERCPKCGSIMDLEAGK